jgi:hypothetical protein
LAGSWVCGDQIGHDSIPHTAIRLMSFHGRTTHSLAHGHGAAGFAVGVISRQWDTLEAGADGALFPD